MVSLSIPVLDKGYVRYLGALGNDLTVVNAARVSFAKESDLFDEKDQRLLQFLWDHDHTSPFRHATVSFEVKAPLMVARQWWKYVVGTDHTMDAWNESSRRYVTEEPEFYEPDKWRSAPENKKQGSGEAVGPVSTLVANTMMRNAVNDGVARYQQALQQGICVEQARLFLPAYALYVRWRWTTSLQGAMHFLAQRLKDDAQVEIQEYAKAVQQICKYPFPACMELL